MNRPATPNVIVVGDLDGRLKQWFGVNPTAMVMLRPDRFVAFGCAPQEVDARLEALAEAMGLRDIPTFAQNG